MNQGGEPGHDDYGLPRVDIKVPDDARELERDVQAYYRELRALRRRDRSRRWRAPLHRSGVVIPLVAGCLVLAMIASMVLTMFSSNPDFSGTVGKNLPDASGRHSGADRRMASSAAPAVRHGVSARPTGSLPATASPAGLRPSAGAVTAGPGQEAGVPLPSTTITVAGKPVALRGLKSTALAIVPAHCGCAMLVRQLISQASTAKVTVYLVGPRGSRAELDNFTPGATAGTAIVAIDPAQVLDATYRAVGLTVLLVDSHGTVVVSPRVRPGFRLESQLALLKPAG